MMPDIYNDGWKRFSGDWQYVSASSFKTAGNVTAEFPAGTKLRYHQIASLVDTTYYSQVASASYNSTTDVTTITILTGSATIANSAISQPCYSYEDCPQGYPTFYNDMKMVRIALTPGNANAFAFAWQNPESTKIIVHKVVIYRTAAGGTGSSVLDVGPADAATGTADTIIDGLDLNATGLADSIADGGTNGLERSVLLTENGGNLDHITGKILAQNAASLAGYVYIYYNKI